GSNASSAKVFVTSRPSAAGMSSCSLAPALVLSKIPSCAFISISCGRSCDAALKKIASVRHAESRADRTPSFIQALHQPVVGPALPLLSQLFQLRDRSYSQPRCLHGLLADRKTIVALSPLASGRV